MLFRAGLLLRGSTQGLPWARHCQGAFPELPGQALRSIMLIASDSGWPFFPVGSLIPSGGLEVQFSLLALKELLPSSWLPSTQRLLFSVDSLY